MVYVMLAWAIEQEIIVFDAAKFFFQPVQIFDEMPVNKYLLNSKRKFWSYIYTKM